MCRGSRAGSVVFVDSRYNQSYLHAETIKVFQENDETLSELLSPSCYESLVTLYCHLLYPDCLTKGSQNYSYPSPLCSDACFTAFGHKGSCASSYREAIAIYQLSFANKSITPLHMVSEALNCAQLPSSADSQCMMLKTLTSPTATGSPFSIVIVASGALVVIILVAVILIICTCRRRRKSRNETYDTDTGRSSCPNDRDFPFVLLRPSLWDLDTEKKIRKVAISPDRLQIQDIIGEGASVEIHLFIYLFIYLLHSFRQLW